MKAKDALKKLKSYIKLMELHNENEFKIKQFNSFVFEIENSPYGLKEILKRSQTGDYKLTEAKQTLLYDLLETETFPALDELMSKTPVGVWQMTKISGLGSKKVRILWQDLNCLDLNTLKHLCEQGEVSKIKGFGQKTEQNILESINYLLENESKLLMSEGELVAENVLKEIKDFLPEIDIQIVGDVARNLSEVSKIQFAIDAKDKSLVFGILNNNDLFEKDAKNSSMFSWKGFLMDVKCPIEVLALSQNKGLSLLKLNSSEEFMSEYISKFQDQAQTEAEVFEKLGLPFIPTPLREVQNIEFIESKDFDLEKIVKASDIKGCLHNHSVYSDGQNTIAEMVSACKSMGLSYFGISDHSQTASYAGGLKVEEVIEQHKEIDEWNVRSSGFKIYKGIESDILNDGSLDYAADVLKTFDFIVASVHANLTMKKDDATARLIKAIENPYTTILGHPTGRLLVRRKGYELDMLKVIDACAANKVCIEINSNPWRLDLDWTFVRYAAEKGVMLALNPDAHEIDGLHDMQYGLKIAQKVALYPEQILNCLEQKEVEQFFKLKR
jgi:DNA polymerase (family X)